ncbi:pentapeptide repeat-containing protein [Roseovarius aestuarii]|uniref:Uncharacterized protein n=1 Tax=Roseovarius aestuarii TaxID=475083 RepID=A0A1X7BWX3_9RHOB|nr:pentapeptide repeat-containing protein [Roseovarius aestuarii]SMC14151.1 hypothetical protein ROA7745_04016 [Roseovarius aestuarii]
METFYELAADPLFWKLAIPALAVAILLALIWRGSVKGSAAALTLAGERMGLGNLPPALIGFAFLTWGVFALMLLIGLYSLIWEVIWHAAIPESEKDRLWNWRFLLAQLAALATVLGAVIALPVSLNRLFLARRQTETAENQLFNNKLNRATTDLAARHQVTREIGRGQQKRILTEWQDDLLTRAAAIDRLEGLVHEREEEAPRIARTLSLYVRELTRIYAPETAPKDASAAELRAWARGIQPVRPDMESAAQSLGQLQSPQMPEAEPVKIDLRHANLQGFNLNSLRLRNAQLTGAALRLVDFTNIPQIADHLGDVFGDGTVILPGGHAPDHADWPAHWPKEELSHGDFMEKWREWQAGLEGYEAPEPSVGDG